MSALTPPSPPRQLLLACIPVVGDDFVSMIQLLVGEEDVAWVCDGEEVLGPTHKCALVPAGLLNVYRGGNLRCHGCAAESQVSAATIRSQDLR